MKKILTVILVLLFSLTLLSACGGLEDPPPLPSPRVRGEIPASPINDPPPATSGSEGFYTIVALGEDGEDILDFYIDMGFNINDLFVELRRGSVARLGIFPIDESDIDEGTFIIDGSSITFYFDGGEIDGTIEDYRISFAIDGVEMIFEKNYFYFGPDFGDYWDASESLIHGYGGTFLVNPPMEFTFIPNQTGVWEFRTSNNEGDPYLELFGGEYGGIIHEDDDSGDGENAVIYRVLRAGDEFRLLARNWGSSDTGSFMLTVQLFNPIAIPGGGASIQVNDRETYFVFVPNTSGMWVFETSDNGDSDPKLHIYDANGVELYDDDDSGGNMNALINARLESGTTYYIRATFFFTTTGNYLLNVTLS